MRREKTKIYLDTNVYNRPFDDQGQMRIRLEAEAFLSIMEKAASKSIIIIGSSALMYENSQNPFIERRERISSFLSIAATTVTLNDAIRNKALILQVKGIDAMDALHLAYAEAGKAEYFLTCDDDVIRKITNNRDMLSLEVCNPLEFILKEVFRNA